MEDFDLEGAYKNSMRPCGIRPFFRKKISNSQISESAKLEYERQVELYQFHVGAYIRGIAFFLAINALLLKFAIDDLVNRTMFAIFALSCGLAILIPLVFSFCHVRNIRKDFQRLAVLTKTQPISVAPFVMLSSVTLAFWIIIFGAWGYLLLAKIQAIPQ